MKHHPADRRKIIRLVGISMVLLAAIVILPQATTLRDSLLLLRDLNLPAVIAAISCICLTFMFAALNYQLLARKPIKYHRSVLVSIANMFTNRLLPAGTGSIATFFLYLRRNKHTITQAGSVIAVNNILGVAAHGLLLIGLFLLFPDSFQAIEAPQVSVSKTVVILVLISIVILLLSNNKSIRNKVTRYRNKIRQHLVFYRLHPLRISGVLASATMITTLNAAVLWFCSLAVGIQINPIVALIVFSVGIVVGTLTPTPGGLGGAEAGLLAGLIAFGVAAEPALAAVILYRLLSYWLTLLAGAGMYAYISKRGYLYSNRDLNVKSA